MNPSLFPAEAFVVTCLPAEGGKTTASYCVSDACAKVLNPDPVCDDIARAHPE